MRIIQRILVGYGTYHGAFRIRIDTIIKEVNPYSQKGYVDWYYINLNTLSILSLHVSPESKNLILKFKDSVSNVKVKNYDYEILDNERILIKNLKTDYLKVILNSIFVIAYCFILATVLNYSKSVFFRHFSIIFTIFFIYLLSYFPGIYDFDPFDQVKGAYYFRINDCSPPLQTLIIAIILKLFHHIAFYTLIQIILISILFAWIMSKLKLDRLIWYWLIFLIFPITGLYSIYGTKDVPYSLSLIWLSFLLYFCYIDKNYAERASTLIALLISISLVILLRYNGLPIAIISMFLIFLLFRNLLKFTILLTLVTIVVLFAQIVYYKVLGIESSKVCKYQKDFFILNHYVFENFPFSTKDKKIIESILPFQEIRRIYNCSRNTYWDSEKTNWDQFNKHAKQIRKIFLKTVSMNAKPLISHIFCNSKYIWSFGKLDYFYFLDYKHPIYENFMLAYLYPDKKLPQIAMNMQEITNALESNFNFLFRPAIYFYAILIPFLFKSSLRILLLLPLLNSLILVFISPSSEFRYTYSNYLLSVILIIYFLEHIRSKKL